MFSSYCSLKLEIENMPNNKKAKKNHSNKHCSRGSANNVPSLQRVPNASGKNVVESGGCYTIYKEANWKFFNWMAHEACPNSKMTAVNDYRTGVQQILDRNRCAYLEQ